MAKLTEREVLSAVRQHKNDSTLFTTEIHSERKRSLERYNRRPIGNEVDGSSKFLTNEVFDTSWAIIPDVVDMFRDPDSLVFTPRNSDDIEQSTQETQYVRHVFWQQNQGFDIATTFCQDGIVQKNGYVQVIKVDGEDETIDYENMGHQEFLKLVNDDSVEVKEITSFLDGEEQDSTEEAIRKFEEVAAIVAQQTQLQEGIPAKEQGLPTITHKLNIIKKGNAKIKVRSLVPERTFVARDHTQVDLKEVSYIGYSDDVSRSDLLDRFPDKKQEIEDLMSSSGDIRDESISRYSKENNLTNIDVSSPDDAAQNVAVTDHYIRLDVDGNGHTELHHVVTGGASDDTLLQDKVVDAHRITSWTPYPNAHRHYGTSIGDLMSEIQELGTTLWRQSMDNIYLSNRPYVKVGSNAKVNLDDLMTRRPGGIVRCDGPISEIQESATPFVARDVFTTVAPALEEMKEQRSGVNKLSQGLDVNALSNATNVVGMSIMNISQKKIKFIAQQFANSMREVFIHIHELVIKFEDNDRVFRVNGKFVPINPTEWVDREEMEVNVGPGSATRIEKQAFLQESIRLQQTIIGIQGGAQGPLVNLEDVFNLLNDFTATAGIASPDRYFSDPSNFVPPQQEPDPLDDAIELEAAKMEVKATGDAAKLAAEIANNKEQNDNDRLKIILEDQREREKLGIKVNENIIQLRESITSQIIDGEADND